MVGINTAIIAGAQGIGFSIPSNTVHAFIKGVLSTGISERPWLGVHTVPQHLDTDRDSSALHGGLLVLDAIPDSPAEKAGLQVLDVLLAIDGEPVGSTKALQDAIEARHVGDQVDLIVERNGRRIRLSVRLEALPRRTMR